MLYIIVRNDAGVGTPVPLSADATQALLGNGSFGQPPTAVTSAIGYTVGVGGAVAQVTSKSTGVTLNKLCGTITLSAVALAAGAIVSFIVTNSMVAATDVIAIQHDSVGTIGGYTVMPNTASTGSFRVSIRNNTAGSLSEAIVLRFVVIKAVTS